MNAGKIEVHGEKAVASSFVHGVKYAEQSQSMFVRFANACYVYFGVPKVTVTRWLKARNGGTYFRRNVLDKYEFEKIDESTYQSIVA